MSADNGVYIAGFSDGFRVAEAAAISNISYPHYKHPRALSYQYRIFQTSPNYDTFEDAEEAAISIYDTASHFIEYGICKTRSFDHKFPEFKAGDKIVWLVGGTDLYLDGFFIKKKGENSFLWINLEVRSVLTKNISLHPDEA